jgi:hypothetical protein
MTRGAYLLSVALAEASIFAAGGVVVATACILTGRGLEWLLVYRQLRAEERQNG